MANQYYLDRLLDQMRTLRKYPGYGRTQRDVLESDFYKSLAAQVDDIEREIEAFRSRNPHWPGRLGRCSGPCVDCSKANRPTQPRSPSDPRRT